ncbi:hypothetical protein HK107_06010 [Parvularcula sp. ZS-1/3]|uniref:Uncharacterized protein n=1 Tax=Parvularcula mediterranea TaxID=2732508 RepID=A0A7Y3W4L2_9PROT|nr:hypothetical protein [Parvularcula mediterranea]NNU15875.1 hypothetical protein [Parvularcula mediterranea]
MFKLLLAAALAALLLKPVSEMTLEECQERLVEISMEIAKNGGAITPEQEAEMAAIEARLDELINGKVADVADEMAGAEAEAEARDALTMPDTMPLDDVGRAIANALPGTFNDETCNDDTADVYQNYTAFYQRKPVDPKPEGILFSRRCGSDDGNSYDFSVDTTPDGKAFARNVSTMTAERRREEGVEALTLCGLPAFRSRGFQTTIIILGDEGNISLGEWEGSGRPVAARFATQAAMAEATDCKAILAAVSS